MLLPLFGVGCAAASATTSPDAAIDAYADALAQGDAAAIHAMLDATSARSLSKEELRRLFEDLKPELAEQARALRAAGRSVKSGAEIAYPGGEVVHLDLEGGAFRVAAADALPAGARTPSEALAQLRKALSRGSYRGLLRVLSPRTRAAIAQEMRALLDGLAAADALLIELKGDSAFVNVPGGHRVQLRRTDGIWYVEDMH